MASSATVLQALLDENHNHPKVKQTIRLIIQTREKVNYHSLISSNSAYLHIRGLANHQYDEFNHINKMLHQKIMGVCAKIKRQQLCVRNPLHEYQQIILQKQRQEEQKIQELKAEVEHVVNNIDLPLSLFKRNDKYWYPDNPKTIEAKNFVHQRNEEDRKRKRKLRAESLKRQKERQPTKEEIQKQQRYEEERKKKLHEEIKNKIQNWKRSSSERQKLIKQSEKQGSAMKPLFKKIQTEEQKKESNALNEYKQKLLQIRNLHKSIDNSEIKEHRQKLQKLAMQKQQKLIKNDPLKVSFKSKYHSSMTSRSRVSEYETHKSLYVKRKQYGSIVKQEFVPQINDDLVREMEERLKMMKRRRTKKNPKKKKNKKKINSDGEQEDDDDQEDEEEQEQEQQQKSESLEDDDQDDDDDSQAAQRKRKKKKKIKIRKHLGEDEDYNREERYAIGVNHLEFVRNLPKKRNESRVEEQVKQEVKAKNSQRYKDYLKEFVKTNRTTIDHIDTNRMKKSYNKSILNHTSNDYQIFSKLQNQARVVQTKIKNEEQLLKFRKLKDQQAIDKKVEIDNAVIDTIKARLALMG